ncbi:unnamed protein product, partial [Allacma fusca]
MFLRGTSPRHYIFLQLTPSNVILYMIRALAQQVNGWFRPCRTSGALFLKCGAFENGTAGYLPPPLYLPPSCPTSQFNVILYMIRVLAQQEPGW